jgi:hypothetical protein
MKQRIPTPIIALGIAAVSVFASPSAFAGPKELAILQAELAKLPGAPTLATASGEELALAVENGITLNLTSKKINIGAIAGEALKGGVAVDAGEKIGSKLASSTNTSLTAKINVIASDAAVTAATGAGPDSSQTPEFIEQIVADNTQATTIATAAVKKSKTAAGAIIGGRALELATDGDRTAFANASIANKKLASGAQSITQYVGDTLETTSIASFASTVASANLKLITSIAPGAVASDPLQARSILDTLFTGATAGSAVKSASKLATGMSLVANAEQVEQMAETFGLQIGSGTSIKSSSINAIAKGLISGLVKRPTDSTTGSADSIANKMDEIGEVGAYLLAGAINHPDFDKIVKNKAKAVALITGLMKTIVAAARDKTNPTLQASVARDIAGSIALTLNSLGTNPFASPTVLQQIQDAFVAKAAATAKKILGAKLAKQTVGGVPVGTLVATALTDGINNTNSASTKYEDGTITEQVQVGAVVDPVTDIRNG